MGLGCKMAYKFCFSKYISHTKSAAEAVFAKLPVFIIIIGHFMLHNF